MAFSSTLAADNKNRSVPVALETRVKKDPKSRTATPNFFQQDLIINWCIQYYLLCNRILKYAFFYYRIAPRHFRKNHWTSATIWILPQFRQHAGDILVKPNRLFSWFFPHATWSEKTKIVGRRTRNSKCSIVAKSGKFIAFVRTKAPVQSLKLERCKMCKSCWSWQNPASEKSVHLPLIKRIR